jgi:hypothetical protein
VRDEHLNVELTVAEEEFRSILWACLCIGARWGSVFPLCHTNGTCDTVAVLDDMVQKGLVARARAAALCNVLAAMDKWCVGLLWHVVDCRQDCLHKVLAWGVCPHVGSSVHAIACIYGVLGHGLRMAAVLELLSYGACPWYAWRPRDTGQALTWPHDWPGDDDIAEDFQGGSKVSHLTVAEIRVQWRRWHARLRKRQWVMLRVTLLGRTPL